MLYPALKAHMGSWDYYIVKMKMQHIVNEVRFASEIYENKTLDEAIQRGLTERKDLVKYLALRDDRFFSSIVVAALGGNPTFIPVDIADDPRFAILSAMRIDEPFGVLTFDGGQKYYALDGQHRLKAIETLIKPSDPNSLEMPEGFLDEEISVIMIVRREARDHVFLQSYRRLFSSLNRWARPTNTDTNIIMDEDDTVAILTRRLVTDHEFFVWRGKPHESPLLKTQGKNLSSGDSYFTTLQTLYNMNEKLLLSAQRERMGFHKREYKQFRPQEDELDLMFSELVLYWDAMRQELDILNSDPTIMRDHDAAFGNPEGRSDCLLFWPIGQELLADVIRILLTRRLPDPDGPKIEQVCSCIRVLSKISWELSQPPWFGLLLIEDPERRKRRMRNEDRKRALVIAKKILLLQTGVDDYPTEDLAELKIAWHAMLIPRPDREEVDATWDAISTPVG